MIEAAVAADDRRKVELTVTARGRDVVARITPEAMKTEAELLEVLSSSERQMLETIMGKLFDQTMALAREA